MKLLFITPRLPFPPTKQTRTQRICTPKCQSDTCDIPHNTARISRRHLLHGLTAAALFALPNVDTAPLAHAAALSNDVLFDDKSGSFVPLSAIDTLFKRDIGCSFDRCIVAGEVHDNMSSHAAQLKLIDRARCIDDGRQLVIGFEQFYRSHNVYLDQYIKRKISLEALLAATKWDETWGFESRLYEPIFEYCRYHKIPMVGLNVPTQLIRLVALNGIDALPNELKQYLPRNMDMDNKLHFRHFVRLLADSGHLDAMDMRRLLRMYEAQVLWEEWMSESIALVLNAMPDSRVVALVGNAHVEERSAFPDRIERRSNERPYTVVPRPVLWTLEQGHAMPGIDRPERHTADVIWYTRRKIDMV